MSHYHNCAVHGSHCTGHHHLHVPHDTAIHHSGANQAKAILKLGFCAVAVVLAVTGIDPVGAIGTAAIKSLTGGK